MEKKYQADVKGEKTPEQEALYYFFTYKNPINAVNEKIKLSKKSESFSNSESKLYLKEKYGVDIDAMHKKEISFLKEVKKCLEPIISEPGCI